MPADLPSDFVAILVINLPLVLGLFLALHRGYIVMGRTFDRERAEWKESFLREYSEKKEAQERLVQVTEAMKSQAEVMERAVQLAERRA